MLLLILDMDDFSFSLVLLFVFLLLSAGMGSDIRSSSASSISMVTWPVSTPRGEMVGVVGSDEAGEGEDEPVSEGGVVAVVVDCVPLVTTN